MKAISITLALALATISAGCSNIERSRNLGDPNVTGATLAAQVCSNCHGLDGNSVSPNVPRLSGQTATYITNQLKNFKTHDRSDPAGFVYMWGLSRSLTDKQIDELADYYSKQTSLPNATGDTQLIAVGKEVYEKGVPEQNVIACAACHGPQGQGIANFPRLAHQHADYILKQLLVFQDNVGRPGTPMELIAHPLTGENKAAVAAYLQAFPTSN